jgi:GntR family transcriptional regulator
MLLQRVGIPIYLQVKNYISDKIKAGEFQPGTKIPTERELATQLGISRNTVSAAYKELLFEGVLEARQGRGTFVKACSDADDDFDGVVGGRRERLLRIIDEAMAKVVELGFTVEQFAAFTSIRAKEKADAVREIHVAVVDCTAEYILHFIRQINQVANVQFKTVLLAELEQGIVPIELLHACDLVLTTHEHQEAVTRLMGNGQKLVAVATVPNLETIIKLARLPVATEVGVIVQSEEFVTTFKRLLSRVAISGLRFDVHHTLHREELREFVGKYKVLVVSEEREYLVRQLAVEGQDVIVFYYEIDQGSLQQVVTRLLAQTL